jgi:hypothetical protein
MNYFNTYASVVTWFAFRIIMVLALLFGHALRQIDFIHAYPQAPIEQDMYMELPLSFKSIHGNLNDHVLQLLSNLYDQKQARRVWNSYMVTKLLDIGFEQNCLTNVSSTRVTLFLLSTLMIVFSWTEMVLNSMTSSSSSRPQSYVRRKLQTEDDSIRASR